MFAQSKPKQKKTSKDIVQKKEPEQAVSSPNLTGIPDIIKTRLENSSGVTFEDVRVHYNSQKPDNFGALAYTKSPHVFLAPGQEKCLNHELGHVIQQKQGLVRPTGSIGGMAINDNAGLEKAADNFSSGICESPGTSVSQAPSGVIQRWPKLILGSNHSGATPERYYENQVTAKSTKERRVLYPEGVGATWNPVANLEWIHKGVANFRKKGSRDSVIYDSHFGKDALTPHPVTSSPPSGSSSSSSSSSSSTSSAPSPFPSAPSAFPSAPSPSPSAPSLSRELGTDNRGLFKIISGVERTGRSREEDIKSRLTRDQYRSNPMAFIRDVSREGRHYGGLFKWDPRFPLSMLGQEIQEIVGAGYRFREIPSFKKRVSGEKHLMAFPSMEAYKEYLMQKMRKHITPAALPATTSSTSSTSSSSSSSTSSAPPPLPPVQADEDYLAGLQNMIDEADRIIEQERGGGGRSGAFRRGEGGGGGESLFPSSSSLVSTQKSQSAAWAAKKAAKAAAGGGGGGGGAGGGQQFSSHPPSPSLHVERDAAMEEAEAEAKAAAAAKAAEMKKDETPPK